MVVAPKSKQSRAIAFDTPSQLFVQQVCQYWPDIHAPCHGFSDIFPQ